MTTTEPLLQDLDYRGFIEGVKIVRKSTHETLCHYFGGIPYASPPVGPFRWQKPRALPVCYRYGTRANPGRFNGGAAMCPQQGVKGLSKQELLDEDCLQLNIYVPAGTPPDAGWPVYFYIHGGFLQVGTPNTSIPSALIGETDCKCIFVLPAYRLNLFGFLSSRELYDEAMANKSQLGCNYGFWDLRLALEWTHKNISYFGGNAGNITVGGYSAGSHSAFHQLAYDLYLPKSSHRVIRRVVMWSNGPGLQPKSLQLAQEQFDSLLSTLPIPLSLPAAQKLARLRATPSSTLLAAASKLTVHEFRAVTDDSFVRKDLFADMESGGFAHKMREQGKKLMIGECANEHFVYATWHPPRDNSVQALRTRLEADYPRGAVAALLDNVYFPGGRISSKEPYCNYSDKPFGQIYADLQIHATERGFIHALAKGGAADLIHRYRIEWLAESSPLPHKWGATHSTDLAIWLWGNRADGKGLTDAEKMQVKPFVEGFWEFLRSGEVPGWKAKSPLEVTRLKSDGRTDIWKDNDWERSIDLWNVLMQMYRETASQDGSKAQL